MSEIDHELTPYQPPALTRTAAEILARAESVRQVMAQAMKKDRDYGVIPGCGGKPTLLKSGAEKLASTFKLAIDPQVEDMSTADEVRYRVTARVTHAELGAFLGSGIGEASSDETKYRWRAAVSEMEYAATPEDRKRLKFYRSGNPAPQVRTEPRDVANTILKMAKKRALVDAVLTITAASDVFTQDLEDLEQELAQSLAGEHNQAPEKPPVQPPQRKSASTPAPPSADAPPWLPEGLRVIAAKFPGDCAICAGQVAEGDTIAYSSAKRCVYHLPCLQADVQGDGPPADVLPLGDEVPF